MTDTAEVALIAGFVRWLRTKQLGILHRELDDPPDYPENIAGRFVRECLADQPNRAGIGVGDWVRDTSNDVGPWGVLAQQRDRIVGLEAEVAELTDQNRLRTKLATAGLLKAGELGDRIAALEAVIRRLMEDPCILSMYGCVFHEPEACPTVEAKRLLGMPDV